MSSKQDSQTPLNLGFSKIIDEIEAQIEPKYIPGCWNWADETKENAWTKAADRFNYALVHRKDHHPEWIKAEAELYKITCLDLINQYKKYKNLDSTDQFIKALKAKTETISFLDDLEKK